MVYVSNQVYGNLRPGMTTMEKWKILDGKVESGLILDSGLRGDSPCLCRLRTALISPCCNKH
jgi:hypothetical protein